MRDSPILPEPLLVPLRRAQSAEERVAAYVIREHERGRDLAEILEDRYVQNRSTRSSARACSTGPR